MTAPRPASRVTDLEFARLERCFTPATVRFILEHYGTLLDARPPGPKRDADPGPVRHTPTHAPAWERGALERAAVAGAMSWLHATHGRLYTAVWHWYCRQWPADMTAWEIAVALSRELALGGGTVIDDADRGVALLARYLGHWERERSTPREGDPGP